ncbi:MAG: hypothetical protein ABSA53_28525, partial [Streptosporangiaceae bacterium]
ERGIPGERVVAGDQHVGEAVPVQVDKAQLRVGPGDSGPGPVKPASVIVNVSIWGQPATIDMQKLVLKELDLRGTIAYVRDHPATIKLVQDGKIDLQPFITARIGLDDLVEDGLGTLIHHKDTAVKILVHP